MDLNNAACYNVNGYNICFYGLVAQLGERCVRNAEAEGSIPFGSTKTPRIYLRGVFYYKGYTGS